MSLLFLTFFSFLLALVLTPLVRLLALRFALTDRPDGHRKLHARAIALGGGAAVFAATTLALSAFILYPSSFIPYPSSIPHPSSLIPYPSSILHPSFILPLLAASFLILLLGLADDRYSLRGRHKLMGQLAAGVVLVASGLVIRRVAAFDLEVDLGLLAVPFTLFWLVGAMNAVNLIDGIDGLATTVGIILSLSLAAMALLVGHPAEAAVALAFAGSLLGFLCFNFPPAKIFLGDSGSMLIGLVIGVLAMRASLKGPATMALAAPLAVWAIPIFDSVAAIVRRKLTGRSIYTVDRGHLHHCLLEVCGSNVRVVGLVAVACAVTCGGALVSVTMQNDLLALLGAGCVAAILLATRVFGHAELRLVTARLRSLGRWMFHPTRLPVGLAGNSSRSGGPAHQAVIRLQGSRQWHLLWTSLTEFAEKLHLHRIELDVNLPAAHEGYHASWESPHEADPFALWRTEIPLLAGDNIVGRLSVTGRPDGASACELIETLADLLHPFETQLVALALAGAPGPEATGEPVVVNS